MIFKYQNCIAVVIISLLFFSFSSVLFADETDTISISAQVNSDVIVTPPGGGGGGGGGGGAPASPIGGIPTTVNFSGTAYPLSRVYILKDGKIAITTIADQQAQFSVSINDLETSTYTFSVYGVDSSGRKSGSFSFPIYITSGTTVNIGNIFISPTIEIDQDEVKRGDNLAIFGQSAPSSEVTISVHSDPEYFHKVLSSGSGSYLYNLDTSVLELGKHQTKSKSALGNELSSYTPPVGFIVGDKTKKKDTKACSNIRGDLNCDSKVNLVDFSIMAFWYKKSNPPAKVDLNNDTKITLIDFSIMAYNWTG